MAGPEITFQFPRYTPEQLADFARQRGETKSFVFTYRSPTLAGDAMTTSTYHSANEGIRSLRYQGVTKFHVDTRRTE